MQVAALLQQLLTHGGFYDEQRDFVRLECVQVVASAVPGSATRQLSHRLTACLRQAVVAAPSDQELEAILTAQLQQVRRSFVWGVHHGRRAVDTLSPDTLVRAV